MPKRGWGVGNLMRPRTTVRKSILLESGGQNQPEFVAQFHRVNPGVDVQDQVHLEGLALAMETTHSVELLTLRINVFNVEDVLEQNTGHSDTKAIRFLLLYNLD